MVGKAAKRLFSGGRTDIWIAVEYRVWWWTVGFLVLVALSGPGCSSSLASPTTVDPAVDSSVNSAVDSAVDSGADSGCAPVLSQSGEDTGFETCTDGTLRRRAALQCPWPPMSPEPTCTLMSTCASDAVCGDSGILPQPKGYCAEAHKLIGYCGCFGGCCQDADCGPGYLCECNLPFGQCVPAECETNADCGAGFACVATAQGTPGGKCNQVPEPPYPPLTLFVCQTAADSCRGQTDCAAAGTGDAGPGASPSCLFDGTRRACGVFCPGPPG
jgi:hypothetical protein